MAMQQVLPLVSFHIHLELALYLLGLLALASGCPHTRSPIPNLTQQDLLWVSALPRAFLTDPFFLLFREKHPFDPSWALNPVLGKVL